jgi:hypothetical protein
LAAEFEHCIAILAGQTHKFKAVPHPISVPEPGIQSQFLARARPWKTDGDVPFWVYEPALDHRSEPAFAQSDAVSLQHNWLSRLRHFDENYRDIDFHSGKPSHTIKFWKALGGVQYSRSCQVPIVLNVFRLTKQFISNIASAGSARWKFFAANHHRLVRWTVAIEMPDEVNAAHRSELAWFAH